MSEKYRTSLYSPGKDDSYCFREAFENASGKWDVYDVDEAAISAGDIVKNDNARFPVATDVERDTARSALKFFEEALNKGSAVTAPEDALAQAEARHFKFM